jgi:hypothetical protein
VERQPGPASWGDERGRAICPLPSAAPAAKADRICGPGQANDATRQICAPYLPANPPPGYPQPCQNGFYDPAHGICTDYPPPIHRRFTLSGD